MIAVLALLGCSALTGDQGWSVPSKVGNSAPYDLEEDAGESVGFGSRGGAPIAAQPALTIIGGDQRTEEGGVYGGVGGGAPMADAIMELEEKRDGTMVMKDKSEFSPPPPPGEAPARVREWFPEAFLWRPSVQTGPDGVADLDVRVPDSLTTWRVLGLAHDRRGQQAGTELRFDSVLPVSVEAVAPGWLYVGDSVQVAAQAAASGAAFTGRVEIDASGAVSGAASGPIALSSGGSRLVRTAMVAERSGKGLVRAELFAGSRVDGAERIIEVRPVGRPLEQQVGGVLSEARTLVLTRSGAAEERVGLRVFPGPLAVFQAELDRVGEQPTGAYGYALLAGVRALSDRAGVAVDEGALRRLQIQSWQRLVREARSPDARQAMGLLLGLRAPEGELATGARDRLVNVLESAQRGDGTWSTASRSSAQQVLVETSTAIHALPADRVGARLRGSGAIERLLPNVEDPYTAAWVLASGAVDVTRRPALEELIIDGLITVQDGRHTVAVPPGVRSAWGDTPSRPEVLAVTWMALRDRTDLPWRGDLLSELLQGWSSAHGLGAGVADSLVLEALLMGLPSVDQPVAVIWSREGEELGRGALDPAQPNVPVVLETEGGGTFTVRTEPLMPGLAFVASHTAWMPFTGAESLPGVEVEVSQGALIAGQPGTIRLVVAAPSGATVELSQGLPAGTSAELPSTTLQQLASSSVRQDQVRLTTTPFRPGEIKELEVLVTPMYAGQMGTRPLTVTVGTASADLAPMVWSVGQGG